MKKLESRALLCLFLAAVLLIGMGVYVVRYVRNGSDWALFYANSHIYSNGMLAIGTIYDRNGTVLAANGQGTDGAPAYNSDETIRRATAHAVGDPYGNVSTGAETAMRDRIIGYDVIGGVHSLSTRNQKVTLTIDADICKTAYEALGYSNGFVGVYNYKTGEIICEVSKPTFDPANMPADGTAESGTYLNKFLSGRFVPGSTFKLVTSAAAIETVPDIGTWRYSCSGSDTIGADRITCTHAHGDQDFTDALANSCNGAFAQLSLRTGADTLQKYTEKCGLTKVYSVSGVGNIAGTFEFPENESSSLAWSGIGQWKDLVNPCSLMVYMGAIARDGESVEPRLIHSSLTGGTKTGRMIEKETAAQLRAMMKKNVTQAYGEGNFPGLDIYAKSGTAEVGSGRNNAWFVGFLGDAHPYAFVVCVENGTSGVATAGPVANRVLSAIVAKEG